MNCEIDAGLAGRLYRQAKAEQWQVPVERFTAALEASAARVFAGRTATARELERYLRALHLEDLALACACALGVEPAWDRFVRDQRPALYRAADALDPGGGARELADSLYADLYGLTERDGVRQSLFRYFHGRSSLATWLRAVLAQRHVDRARGRRRLEPLPAETALPAAATEPDPDRLRYLHLARTALDRAIAALRPRDRFRLRCYYAQQLTLAQTGKLLREHEATVSRQLARTRRAIRQAVEQELGDLGGLDPAQIERCFECIMEDTGPIDLDSVLHADPRRKKPAVDRSQRGGDRG